MERSEDHRPDLIEIDLSRITTPHELQERLREALGFPDWYGHNWDAFWDAITGLGLMPARLRFLGWSEFSRAMPLQAQMLIHLLNQANDQQPDTDSMTLVECV